MTTEDLQGQVARSAAVERELREEIGKLRAELAEARRDAKEALDFWERANEYAQILRPKLAAATARATAAESALAEAREALGDISTRCEDKELRYWNTPTKEAVQKRQAIIDYVWSAARAALARAGEQGVLVVCDHAPNEPHQKDGAMPGRVSRHLCLHPRAGEQAPLPEKQLSGSAGPGCGACAEESKEGMPSGSLHGAGEPASSGQEGPAATLFEHYPLPWSIRTDYVSTRQGMYGPETVTHSHGTPQIRDARNVNIMSFSRKQEGDVLLAEWILRTANAQSATPPPGEQGKGADALADGIALVEGWWRRKCGALQRTHAPNLGSARVDATEVEELLRRMRALATAEPEQGKSGGEGPHYGRDCPVGMVQVEFVGCSPSARYSEYGWKPTRHAFLEVYVDGKRFRIDVGEFEDGHARRRGLHIVTDAIGIVFDKTAMNSASIYLAPAQPAEHPAKEK